MSIECIGFTESKYMTVIGYADFWVPKMGLYIYDCAVHKKGDARWINFPIKTFIDKEIGEKRYSPIFKFKEKKHHNNFVGLAKKALDRFLLENNQDKMEEQK